jgi:hypothetical protein
VLCAVEVTLRAKIGNKPFISNTKIDLNDARPGDLIHKLAAKSTLRYLHFLFLCSYQYNIK